MTLHIPQPREGRFSARLFVAGLAAGSLLVGGLIAPSAHAAVDATPEAQAAGDWLQGELTSGLIYNEQYALNDYGLSIDAGISLQAVESGSAISDITTALAPKIDSYTTGVDFDSAHIYSSAVAKAAAFALFSGADPSAFGGVDLIDRLEARISATAPIAGRTEDLADVNDPGDYANSIGQSFAVVALDRVDSTEHAAALSFLLKQQCSAGFFRLSFTPDKTAANQTCDAGTADESAADTDVTALVLANLQRSGDTSAPVTMAISKGVAWLLKTQAASGAFGGGPSTEQPNTNSAGLAGIVLGEAGNCAGAARAARYVASLQVPTGVAGALAGDEGAIAYDTAAMTAGETDGIDDTVSDQWRRATAQAFPALNYLADDAPVAAISGSTKYIKAGTTTKLSITGVPTGAEVCVSGLSYDRSLIGTASTQSLTVTVPTTSGTYTYLLSDLDSDSKVNLKVLAKAKLKVNAKKAAVKKGKKQKVVVTGLAPGEKVKIKVDGKVVAKGKAKASGKFKATFKVKAKRGKAKVKVTGEFANRKGTDRFLVR